MSLRIDKNIFDKYDYLFFDFDGVILDSKDIKIDGFAKIYQKYGKAIADKVIKCELENRGISRFKKFKLYHKEFLGVNLTANQIEEFAKEYSRIVFKKISRAKYIEGAPQFLERCKRQGKTCFLISATPELEIKKIVSIRNLKKFFKEVKGSPKSKKENIRDLIEKYKIDRKKTVFFGDSATDIEGADGNNIRFIGINCSEGMVNFRNFKQLTKERER